MAEITDIRTRMDMTGTNMPYLKYTYLHRRAFAYVVERLVKDPEDLDEMRRRAAVHDMDKMVYYTLMPKAEASKKHRSAAPHHMENGGRKIYYDFLEAVIDFECAALTKPDKPLNAYDTVLKYGPENYPQHMDALMEIMEKLGIAYSYEVRPDASFNRYMERHTADKKAVLTEICAYYLEGTGICLVEQ